LYFVANAVESVSPSHGCLRGCHILLQVSRYKRYAHRVFKCIVHHHTPTPTHPYTHPTIAIMCSSFTYVTYAPAIGAHYITAQGITFIPVVPPPPPTVQVCVPVHMVCVPVFFEVAYAKEVPYSTTSPSRRRHQ
jgi:hypothetical protein